MSDEADFEKLPEWANWIAMDANGTWFAYEKEPTPLKKEGVFAEITGGAWGVIRKSNWTSSKLKLKKERP